MDDRYRGWESEDWGEAPGASNDGPVQDWGESERVAEPTTVPIAPRR